MTDSRSGVVNNVLYDYDCKDREEWNADFKQVATQKKNVC